MRTQLFLTFVFAATPLPAAPPTVLDSQLRLELVAAEPDIVTPTGIAVDARGRIWCLENHTHQRPANYKGPATDRLRVLEEFDDTGKATKVWTFSEGFRDSMGLTFGSDGTIYVATRAAIFRLREQDGLEIERTRIVNLETKGNYPHNGLCGFAWDSNGDLIFGLGENLGEAYAVVGSDGNRLTGGGEGGSMYRCRPDGSNVSRIATGFWNPFAHCFDANGRLFMVDNDPDARGPCRLCHVIQGGDYGYRFRYGRKGLHPFTSWNGEIPGTLPMAAGTSEAPSGIIACDFTSLPLSLRGQLLVTSWGDHTLEAFTLSDRGASVSAIPKVIVRGNDQFRPVGFAIAPDGSVVVSDWVDQSYPVHGKGRIWRLRSNGPSMEPKKLAARPVRPESEWQRIARETTSPAERMEALLHLQSPQLTREFIPLLGDADPFLVAAALEALGQPGNADMLMHALSASPPAKLRLGLLLALRRTGDESARSTLAQFLADDDPDVRRAAIQWIAEENQKEYTAAVTEAMQRMPITRSLLEAGTRATDMLTGTQSAAEEAEQGVATLMRNKQLPPAVRSMALRMLRPDHPILEPAFLKQLFDENDAGLRMEVVRTAILRPDTASLLQPIAASEESPEELRALALVGLGRFVEDQKVRQLLEQLSGDARFRADIDRSLGRGKEPLKRTPDQWRMLLTAEAGDALAGERLFFHPKGPGCSNCHRIDSRGSNVGPDLTFVGKSMSRERLIDSILEPSKEVAPMYTAWRIQTRDGKERIGMLAGETHDSLITLVDSEGKWHKIRRTDIEERTALKTSIMPDELPNRMTRREFTDLLAYLLNR